MRVLVIGSGGREHALAWKLGQSPRVRQIFIAPGNAGTRNVGQNVDIKVSEIDRLLSFARQESIDLSVVGPDDALAAGIVDLFEGAGLRIFGPTREAAQLESSKSFAKEFMVRHGIPTARFRVCASPGEANAVLGDFGYPVAVKADGLALGKGVVIAHDRDEAESAIDGIMVRRRFGEAGRRVVIEEFLSGTECSVHALVDGRSYLLFPTAQDHKQLYDGNLGPNTGGMGAFSPSHRLDAAQLEEIQKTILDPFIEGIQRDNIPFRGLLFPGLMLTKEGPRVLEFNCRFGDPETQVLVPRLKSDILDLLEATMTGSLSAVTADWDLRVALCVVMASAGYPGSYQTGKIVIGLEAVDKLPDVAVFHAGTQFRDNRVLTSGGRVLGVTAVGATLGAAKRRAYDAAEKIEFDGNYFRRDIGSI
ncbi:MAG TPA: phosphoribosylamine--glycine ligase [Chthoniobacterales bacterium]|nr:phosphoribosylamine--glycine ligase [Chthoniobacterales bacterium]